MDGARRPPFVTEAQAKELEQALVLERAARDSVTTQLHDCEQRLRLLSMTSDDATWDWDLATGDVNRNYAAAALFGDNSPIDNPSVKWWQDHIYADDRGRVIDTFADAIASRQTTVSAEYRFCRADHSFAYIYDRGSIMRDADHKATRLIGTMIDLTALVIVKDSLARTEAALIHAARHSAMGTMASMIAHELNQPLAAIANYVRAGRRIAATTGEPAPENFDGALQAAEDNALRAGGIVRRLRELVRRGHVERQPVTLRSLIDDACAIALIDAEIAQVRYDVDIAHGIPVVLVDPIQIQQVLINLIRNSVEALEHRNDRHIKINVREKGEFVEVSVTDNGPGIEAEIAKDLFGVRASLKASGMGIGLSICRTIVEAHGGLIWLAESDVGAEFRFTLPVN
jgi:signal transduction histidine kinase